MSLVYRILHIPTGEWLTYEASEKPLIFEYAFTAKLYMYFHFRKITYIFFKDKKALLPITKAELEIVAVREDIMINEETTGGIARR